jgi:N-acetylglucosamine kinase-like BadF-type ATPase
MRQSTFIGFDGGGSTSRFLVQRNAEPPELFTFNRNLKYSDLGIPASAQGMVSCLQEILGEYIECIHSMCISLSGASNSKMNEELADELRGKISPSLKVHVESDSSFALRAAYPAAEPGMLLIAGTGSVAVAKDTSGNIVKVGGWGRLLGDEGSGYWIGLEALKHYTRALDDIILQDQLFRQVENMLLSESSTDPFVLRNKLYTNTIQPQNFAPIVFACLDISETAKDIADRAVSHLMNFIKMLRTKVEPDCRNILTVQGGIATQEYISSAMRNQCKELGLRFKILRDHKILAQALEVAQIL